MHEANAVLFLDVRTQEEYAAGAYPGAKHIPVEELEERLEELPRGREIVVYCRTGRRSGAAESFMRAAGFTRVRNAGGLSDLLRETGQKAVRPESGLNPS